MHAYALALMGLAVFAPPALASGTCLVQVDGQRYLDGPCDVRTGRRAIFFDRHGGDRLTVAIVRQEATPDRGEAERSDPAGWREARPGAPRGLLLGRRPRQNLHLGPALMGTEPDALIGVASTVRIG